MTVFLQCCVSQAKFTCYIFTMESSRDMEACLRMMPHLEILEQNGMSDSVFESCANIKKDEIKNFEFKVEAKDTM